MIAWHDIVWIELSLPLITIACLLRLALIFAGHLPEFETSWKRKFPGRILHGLLWKCRCKDFLFPPVCLFPDHVLPEFLEEFRAVESHHEHFLDIFFLSQLVYIIGIAIRIPSPANRYTNDAPLHHPPSPVGNHRVKKKKLSRAR